MKNVLTLLILLLVAGCSSIEEEITPQTQTPVDVYIAGQKNNQACYWKNNQEYLLNDSNFADSKATKIIVFNNDIYVLGKSSDGTAIFWKNNVATNLTATLSTENHIVDNIGDMEINGNDVYFSGQVINNENSLETFNISYWKNGIQNVIEGSTSSYLINNISSHIKVLNNSVIVVYEYGYAINSQIQNQNSEGSQPKGVTIKNNEAYIFGTNHVQNKAYYKNIFTQDETTVNSIDEGYKLIFDLNDIYITNALTIFKNNNIVFESTDFSYYKDFTVLNGNI